MKVARLTGTAWNCAFAALALLAVLAVPPRASAETVEGRWLTQPKNGVVEIYPCGPGTLCGRLVWVLIKPSDNNPQAIDNRNADASLRSRKLCGLVMMWGLKPDGQDHWSGGSIYDPESGKTYRANMTLKPDGLLSVRGYIGISLLGRSQAWTRVTQPLPPCPTRR